jgi:hypothetical protein
MPAMGNTDCICTDISRLEESACRVAKNIDWQGDEADWPLSTQHYSYAIAIGRTRGRIRFNLFIKILLCITPKDKNILW